MHFFKEVCIFVLELIWDFLVIVLRCVLCRCMSVVIFLFILLVTNVVVFCSIYFLISLNDQNFTYIGKTIYLRRQLDEHNSSFGSSSTTPLYYRPYAILGYVCGFNKNVTLMKFVEAQWKVKHNCFKRESILYSKQVRRCEAQECTHRYLL